MRMKQKTIPIFVSHLGCPNDCAFCNQKSITGHKEAVTPQQADDIIAKSLQTLPGGAKVEIGFFGGSFTGIEQNTQKAFLEVANKYLSDGCVEAIRLSTRPDYINEQIIDMLLSYGVTTIELGAQSMDNEVLEKNLRGHTLEDTVRASNIISRAGIKLGLQMMTGLFGDTDENAKVSAEKIIDLSPDCVRIYPTLVLKGTHLETLYQKGLYKPQTLQQAVSLCADLKTRFDETNICVIRMGLMASDFIKPDCDVIAGPYHPAFGELVQSEIYYRQLKTVVKSDCEIRVHPNSVSAFVGNQKHNLARFRDAGISVRFVQDLSISPGTFQIIR